MAYNAHKQINVTLVDWPWGNNGYAVRILYHHVCLKEPTKMIPVFWKQLIFKSFRNSFMKGRNCLHLKTSAHKTTAPLAKINLSIMVPDDGQCRGNAFYWLRYYVKMFCRMQWEGHLGSAFLSAMKQRRSGFQHFDSLLSQDCNIHIVYFCCLYNPYLHVW